MSSRLVQTQKTVILTSRFLHWFLNFFISPKIPISLVFQSDDCKKLNTKRITAGMRFLMLVAQEALRIPSELFSNVLASFRCLKE